MTGDNSKPGYGTYWKIWGILLVITLIMIFIDQPAASALRSGDSAGTSTGLIIVLVIAMLAKAVLIAGWFMHLRFERLILGLSVLIGLLVNGAILYGLIAPDGLRIHGMLQ